MCGYDYTNFLVSSSFDEETIFLCRGHHFTIAMICFVEIQTRIRAIIQNEVKRKTCMKFFYMFMLTCLGLILIRPYWESLLDRFQGSSLIQIFDRNLPHQMEIKSPTYPHLNAYWYWRFPTEDVHFVCDAEIPVDNTVMGFSVTTSWKLLNCTSLCTYTTVHGPTTEGSATQFRISSRIIVDHWSSYVQKPQTETEANTGTRHFAVKETFRLTRIEDNDFASYSCHVDVNFTRLSLHKNCMSVQPVRQDVAVFAILQQERRVHEVFVPPAGMIVFLTDHYWLESRDVDEVMVEYRLNGHPIEEFLNKGTCSLVELVFHAFFWNSAFHRVAHKPRHEQVYRESLKLWTDKHAICISHKMYGVYTFIVRRYFYNSLRKKDFVEAEIPFTVKVGPSYPGSFGNVHENADLSFFTECWEDDKPVLSEECRQRNVTRLHELYYTCLIIPLFLSPYMLWKCLRFLWNLASMFVLDGSLSPPTLDTLVGVPVNWNTFARPRDRPQGTYAYDVFLSYDEQERHFAVGVRNRLRSLGLRVFDCNEDIQPGQPRLLSWNRAIDTSTAFAVIASAAYVANLELLAQFSAMHNLLLSHEIEADRFLIVATDQFNIARSLGPLPIIYPFRASWH